MSQRRPNPEKLLQRVLEDERKEKRGKLKIYLGAAPGVGKTFTMLQDARAKLQQGMDVVIGIVETHGRTEIVSMTKAFESIPRQNVDYKNQKMTEFDLDAVLKRAPSLVLIDEMAHTNVPGLRHNKRWQDIKEVLDRGIDVYTTLNVQHIESLNDVVSQIIHTRIKETVPDSMLELAETIELVDLAPEDLLKRLQEGKVYFQSTAELAAENFFRRGNLTALRELALRITAEQVGTQVLLYRQGLGIKHIWPTQDKLLVCVSSSPDTMKLIRAATRLARKLNATWIAVHVETPTLKESEQDRNNTVQNLRLAEELGAETRLLSGVDIVKEVMDFAREQNVTQIVIGKRTRSRWRDFVFRRLADELVRLSGEIDVYIITGEPFDAMPVKKVKEVKKINWLAYVKAIFFVLGATLINLVVWRYLQTPNMFMMYLLAVCLVSLSGSLGAAIFASFLSVGIFAYLFLPHLSNSYSYHLLYIYNLSVMLLIAIIISHVMVMSRRYSDIVKQSRQRTETLHTLNRQLATTRGVDKLLDIAVRYIGENFDSDVLALMPDNNHLSIRAAYRTDRVLNEKELGVAQWVFDLGQIAGLGTDTLPYSDAVYVPLISSQGTIGVLRIRPFQPRHLLTPDQMHMLEVCANQIAIAIGVDRMQERAKESELEMATDRVRSAMLQAVSHDLRTPIIAIMGAASTLLEMGSELDKQRIRKLSKEIYTESEQLNRLINNILQITYLEAENIDLDKEVHSLEETIRFVVQSMSQRLGKKPINITIPLDLTSVPFDITLIQEVMLNLVDNAIKYTPADSAIDIVVMEQPDFVETCILDRGPGIMPDEVNKLFEKFYRGRMLATERGLGLGLAICYRIVKAHGGKIWAENREGGGASFHFTLPK